MNRTKTITAALVMMVGLSSKVCAASAVSENAALIQHDVTYEQALRYEASPDKTITPAKVIRWIMGMRGQTVPAPSATEFQPIVNAHDGHLRIVAALAYKF